MRCPTVHNSVLYLCYLQRSHGPDFEKNYYESLLIVLDTLEKCLSSQPKDTTRDEAMNVKLLLRETCQFIGKYLWISLPLLVTGMPKYCAVKSELQTCPDSFSVKILIKGKLPTTKWYFR